jgi:GxxExxY protein
MNFKHSELTEIIIKAFFNVYNSLGYGFLEKVYENSMMIELKSLGLDCEKQKPISVFYKHLNVGEYFADIIVENKVIIELKAAEGIIEEHEAQLLNYLKATNIEVGLLFNFGKQPQFKRQIFENEYEKSV